MVIHIHRTGLHFLLQMYGMEKNCFRDEIFEIVLMQFLHANLLKQTKKKQVFTSWCARVYVINITEKRKQNTKKTIIFI